MALPQSPGAMLAAGVISYILGSIPLGHLLWGWLGREELRRLPPHLIGIPAFWRQAGPFYTVAVSFLDGAKGLLAVLLAAQLAPGDPAWLPVAALGVVAGHFYPLLARWLVPAPLPRARGALVALGALLGLALVGSLSLWVPLVSLILWGLTVLTPYVLRSGHGYAALGNVIAALAMPISSFLLGHPSSTVLLLTLLATLILWRHKANLARMVEGLEIGAAQSRPLPSQGEDVTCAFLVHRMSEEDWWQMRIFAWLRPAAEKGWLSLAWLEQLALKLRPMQFDLLEGIVTPDGRRVHIILLGIPLSADQIIGHPELAVQRAVAAARLAEEMGAQAFGLGAYWSVVGEKGQQVQEAVSIPVTNGGAYTAATTRTGLAEALELMARQGRSPEKRTAAVVGAGGVVGFGMARTLADSVKKVIMIGRNVERLERMAQRLARRHPETEIVVSTETGDVGQADIVFAATSQPEAVIYPEHVSANTILFDLGRPADVHPRVAAEVPGVILIPGGVVKPPGKLVNRIDLHFGEGLIPACLAETIILALTGKHEHRSLGERTSTAAINFYMKESVRLGFKVIDSGDSRGGQSGPASEATEPALA